MNGHAPAIQGLSQEKMVGVSARLNTIAELLEKAAAQQVVIARLCFETESWLARAKAELSEFEEWVEEAG